MYSCLPQIVSVYPEEAYASLLYDTIKDERDKVCFNFHMHIVCYS